MELSRDLNLNILEEFIIEVNLGDLIVDKIEVF